MGHKTVYLNYHIDRVKQEEPGGCGIASAAMNINYVTSKITLIGILKKQMMVMYM